MQVILLERVEKLGELGDAVTVKPGYARNYLLPQGKALRATKENLAEFEKNKAERIKANDERRAAAETLKGKIHEKTVVIIRAASEAGHLYGSVTSRDIANAINESLKTELDRSAVVMTGTSKMLGIFDFTVRLHAEVNAIVKVNIAQSKEEAKLQADRVAKGLPALAIGEEEEDKGKEAAKKPDSLAKAEAAAAEAEEMAKSQEAEAEESVEAESADSDTDSDTDTDTDSDTEDKPKVKTKAKVKVKAKAKAKAKTKAKAKVKAKAKAKVAAAKKD